MAENGSDDGISGGICLLRHPHGAYLLSGTDGTASFTSSLPALWWVMMGQWRLAIWGNLSGMIPSAWQALLFRYILSVLLVIYTIWRVEFEVVTFFPEMCRIRAPKMLILLLIAVLIFISTGTSWCSGRPNDLISWMPLKQLWHPVSAIAEKVIVFWMLGGTNPRET